MNIPSLDRIMTKIAEAARRGDVSEVERLTPLASRMRQIAEQKHALETELEEMAKTLTSSSATQNRTIPSTFSANSHPNRITRRATRGGLCVDATFPRSGKLRLEEPTAAETLAVLMEHILTNYGESALEKLQNVRTARGPLVSRNPRTDFLNPRKHEPYGHHRIPGTAFYVLTHSSTVEKIEQIQRALRTVGLPAHAFHVFTNTNGRHLP